MIELTDIWKINNTLVVADSIEDAIVVYKTKNRNESIDCIEKVTHSGNGCAIINNTTSEESGYAIVSKTLIEKTCKWLEEEIAEYIGIDSTVLIESYLKAMEE